MSKLFFYSAVVLSVLNTATFSSVVFAQQGTGLSNVPTSDQSVKAAVVEGETVEEVSLEDLEEALNAENPDLALIDSLIKALIAQDPANASKISSLVQNAPASIQAAVNNSLAQALQTTGTTQAIQANNPVNNNQQNQSSSNSAAQVGSFEEVLEQNPSVVSPN
jgi:hypothetical protein